MAGLHAVDTRRSVDDLLNAAAGTGCRLVRAYRNRHGQLVGEWECPDAEDGQPWATAALLERLTATDDAVDALPTPLVVGTRQKGPRWLHAALKQRVRFVPEKIETFMSPVVLLHAGGGDCDDSARSLVAIARAAGFPARLVYFLQDGQPAHVVAQVQENGHWRWAEITVDAQFGEHPIAAARRLKMRRPDIGGTAYVLGVEGRGQKMTMSGLGSGLPASIGDGFPAALSQLAADLGAEPTDLLKLLLSESGLQPGAKNPRGFPSGQYAVGINQFAPVNWGRFAPLTPVQYAALSATDQLPYVGDFWKALAASHNASTISGRDLYWLNFLPATFVPDAPDSHVIVHAGSGFFAPNRYLSSDGSTITAGDLQAHLDKQADTALYKQIAPLLTGGGGSSFGNILACAVGLGTGIALAKGWI